MTAQATPILRSQDLVFTLYGDYLLDREAPVWVGSLIILLGRLGMSSQAVRTALSRMTHKGWLTVERRGMRSYYGLTRRGHLLLEEGRRRIYHPPRHERWDGAWFLISYSIPENRRQLRDRLRLKLLWLGCGPVTNGLWLSPHDVRSEVREIAHSLRLLRHLEVFRAEHLGFSDTERLVRQCWDLETLDRRYGSFIARWRPQLERCRQGRLPRGRAIRPPLSGLSPEDCFVRRFELTHQYRAFPLEDPYLPARLLPRDWKGDEAAKLFEQYHAALADPADGFLRQVCDAGDDARDGPTALAAGGRA